MQLSSEAFRNLRDTVSGPLDTAKGSMWDRNIQSLLRDGDLFRKGRH